MLIILLQWYIIYFFFFRDEPEVNISELGVSEEYSTETKNELKATANEILNKTEDDPNFNYSKVPKHFLP